MNKSHCDRCIEIPPPPGFGLSFIRAANAKSFERLKSGRARSLVAALGRDLFSVLHGDPRPFCDEKTSKAKVR